MATAAPPPDLTVVGLGGELLNRLAATGSCGSAWRAVTVDALPALAADHRVDVFIADTLEACATVRRDRRWAAAGLILVGPRCEKMEAAAFEVGVDDFVPVPLNTAVLCARVEAVARRLRRPLQEVLRMKIAEVAAGAMLSPREREVLDLLLLGRTAEDVGIALNITHRTAKFHQANVLAKLGAASRHDLLRILLADGA